jgi:glutathione S-transferase
MNEGAKEVTILSQLLAHIAAKSSITRRRELIPFVQRIAEIMSSNIFTLYHAPYSVRSIMVRTAFAMKGAVRDGKSDMTLEYSTVNITNDNPEQLNEKFLCKVNPKGAVPALVNEKLLPEPITECVDISYYICDLYPNLLPEEHESLIKEMLEELHKINFTILTFGPDSNHQAKLADHIRELLSQPSISKEYSEALSRKAERYAYITPFALI